MDNLLASPCPRGFILLGALVLALSAATASAAENRPLLWEIGKRDNSTAEFALAPGNYNAFREDGAFVVGRSDANRDWPYVHPGPSDAWAGSRQHTFSIFFGLKEAPTAGECKLVLDLVDTQRLTPPKLRIRINDRSFERQLPAGAGDESVMGNPAKGKESIVEITCPADALRAGLNQVDLTTLSGSWMLYDWVGFDAPAGTQLAPVSGTIVRSISSPPALVEKDGKLWQKVAITLQHYGEEADAVVKLDGAETGKLHLKPGAATQDALVPAVEKETPATVSVEAAGKVIATQQVTLKPVRKWVLYFLPHSHVDIGYTHLQSDVEKRQWQHLEVALAACKKTADYPPEARFKWNVEVMWAVDSYLKQAPPEKQQALVEAIKAGQIELDALYGNELTALCRPEELARLTSAALRAARRCGVTLESAMISDVPGYTWGIVPVLAQSGVKYFSVGPNEGDRIGYTLAAWGDKPFYWIGPSGKDKILCWIAGRGYSSFHGGGINAAGERAINAYLAKLEADQYPYDIVQLRYNTGGDNGPPDPGICDFARKWNAEHDYPKLVIATTSQLCHDFEKQYADKVPQVKGDFNPYWEDGAASSARETAINRQAAERLVQAETLYAMLAPDKSPADEFHAAWRNVILYDEHTWGAHNSISQPELKFVKDQWAIKAAFATDADAQSKKLMADGLASRANAPTDGEVDVYNTSSWQRTDLVALPKEMRLSGDVVKDPAGHVVPSQRLASGELVFVAKGVPPFAARRYTVVQGKPDAGATSAMQYGQSWCHWLLADALTVAVAKNGDLALYKPRDLEPNDAVDRRGGCNTFAYVPGRDPKGAQKIGDTKVTLRDNGPLVMSLLAESDAPGCNKLTREYRVVAGLNRLDIINTIDKKPVREKEGVHFGFAFNIPNGVMRMDIPWAVARPEEDQIKGACKNWFTVQRWVDISNDDSNDDYGVTWATVDAPLVEVGAITAETPWIEHLKPSQTLYSYVMNNYWHTNYKAYQEGPTTFRYAIRPHKAFVPEDAAKFGIEVSQPLIAVPAAGQPMAQPRLTVDNPAVLVSAFKVSDDGKAWIVRLFGASGKPEKATLKFADPAPAAMYMSDLTETPGPRVNDPIDVPGFGMVTIRAERAER